VLEGAKVTGARCAPAAPRPSGAASSGARRPARLRSNQCSPLKSTGSCVSAYSMLGATVYCGVAMIAFYSAHLPAEFEQVLEQA